MSDEQPVNEKALLEYVENLFLREIRRANKEIGFRDAEVEEIGFDLWAAEKQYKDKIEDLEKQILRLEDSIKVLRKRGPH